MANPAGSAGVSIAIQSVLLMVEQLGLYTPVWLRHWLWSTLGKCDLSELASGAEVGPGEAYSWSLSTDPLLAAGKQGFS